MTTAQDIYIETMRPELPGRCLADDAEDRSLRTYAIWCGWREAYREQQSQLRTELRDRLLFRIRARAERRRRLQAAFGWGVTLVSLAVIGYLAARVS